MFSTARRTVVTAAALGALALGGSAIAGAAQNNSSSSSGTTSSTQAAKPGQPPNGGPPAGPHRGANGKTEQALTGETAAKVKAAALKKVSGGTVERVETDVDHGSPYEAHVTKSDGTQVEVLVNEDFEVTAVKDMRRP